MGQWLRRDLGDTHPTPECLGFCHKSNSKCLLTYTLVHTVTAQVIGPLTLTRKSPIQFQVQPRVWRAFGRVNQQKGYLFADVSLPFEQKKKNNLSIKNLLCYNLRLVSWPSSPLSHALTVIIPLAVKCPSSSSVNGLTYTFVPAASTLSSPESLSHLAGEDVRHLFTSIGSLEPCSDSNSPVIRVLIPLTFS